MIYGDANNLFPPQVDVSFYPSLRDLCAPGDATEQFRDDLIRTLCEESAYHYGFREAPGYNIGEGGIPYSHLFANSLFLETLHRLIDELGRPQMLKALLDRYAQDPLNLVIVHNLGMIFGVDTITKELGPASPFMDAWQTLNKRPEWDRPRPPRPTLEERLKGLTVAERLDRMWHHQDDAKAYMRYLGVKLNDEALVTADYNLIKDLLANQYWLADQRKVTRIAQTFRQSTNPEFRRIGEQLLQQ